MSRIAFALMVGTFASLLSACATTVSRPEASIKSCMYDQDCPGGTSCEAGTCRSHNGTTADGGVAPPLPGPQAR